MPDLLLELRSEEIRQLRSEEIPARMQRKAAGDLQKMVTDGLVEAGLTYEAAREYWTPRRLTLDIRGLTARSRDVREEKQGAEHQGAASRRSRASCARPALPTLPRRMSTPTRRRAISTSPTSSSPGGRPRRSSPSWCRR